jgi:hypothetical protein
MKPGDGVEYKILTIRKGGLDALVASLGHGKP